MPEGGMNPVSAILLDQARLQQAIAVDESAGVGNHRVQGALQFHGRIAGFGGMPSLAQRTPQVCAQGGVQDRAHYYKSVADKTSGKTGDKVALLPEEAMFRTDLRDDGRFEGWYELDVDETEWDPILTTRPFYVQGEYGFPFRGHVWYRLRVEVPASAEGKEVVLFSPEGNPAVWCWVNGEYVGHRPERQYARFHEPRPGGSGVRPSEIELDVTKGIRPGETNQITLRVEIPYTDDTFYDGGHGHVLGGIMSRMFLYSPKEAEVDTADGSD